MVVSLVGYDEDLFHFLLECSNFRDLRKKLIDITSTKNINLSLRNNVQKVELSFAKGSWGFLNALGKFVLEAYENKK